MVFLCGADAHLAGHEAVWSGQSLRAAAHAVTQSSLAESQTTPSKSIAHSRRAMGLETEDRTRGSAGGEKGPTGRGHASKQVIDSIKAIIGAGSCRCTARGDMYHRGADRARLGPSETLHVQMLGHWSPPRRIF